MDINEKIINMIRNSEIHIKTGLCRLILKKNPEVLSGLVELTNILKEKNLFQIIQAESGITLIIEEKNLKKAEKIMGNNIINTKKDLAELIIVSSEKAESIKGYTAFISSLIAEKDINIVSTLGSYTDDIFLISRDDIKKAVRTFTKL